MRKNQHLHLPKAITRAYDTWVETGDLDVFEAQMAEITRRAQRAQELGIMTEEQTVPVYDLWTATKARVGQAADAEIRESEDLGQSDDTLTFNRPGPQA